MLRERRLRLNFIWIQLYYFFRSFIFAYVIERLFWRSRGITIAETVYIEIIYSIVLVVMEVPTGIWADRWSRKRLISIGATLTFIGSLLMLKAYGFWMFAGLIAISGISGALTSGSVSALLYDSLKELEQALDFEKYLSRIKILRYGSGLLAAMIGAWMAKTYGLLLPYEWSVVSCFMMMFFTWWMIEPKRLTASEEQLSAVEIFKTARKTIFTNAFLRHVFLVGALIGSSIVYIEEFWQNYFDALNISVAWFGLISGVMSAAVIFASMQVGRLSHYLSQSRKRKRCTYQLLTVLIGGCFIMLFILRHPLGLLFMLLALFVESLIDTLVLGDIHHEVPSSIRATAESVYAMFSNVASVIIGLVFAYFSNRYNVFVGFISIGLFIWMVPMLEYLIRKQLPKVI